MKKVQETAFVISCVLTMTWLSIGPAAAHEEPTLPPRATGSSDWYPSSITLPSGLTYPCALTPLPKNLSGVPAADRIYINHTYTMILKCIQEKVVLMSKLRRGEARDAYSKYYYATRDALAKLKTEPTPRGLESFRNQVAQAITTQVTFFKKCTDGAEAGTPFQELMNIPEGRQASSLLQAAWGQMAARYPSWDNATKDSIYHHLCALDVF